MYSSITRQSAGQYEVDGVGPHVLVCAYHDVEQVEDSPNAAHYNCQDLVIDSKLQRGGPMMSKADSVSHLVMELVLQVLLAYNCSMYS